MAKNISKAAKEAIGKLTVKEGDAAKNFEAVFTAIVDTYDLKNPVDQMLANLAANQLVKLQEWH